MAGARWQTLPPLTKESYEQRANRRAQASARQVHLSLESAEGNLRARQAALEQQTTQAQMPCIMSNCVFSDADYEKMALAFNSDRFSREYVRELRRQACAPPQQPSQATMAALSDLPAPDLVEKTTFYKNHEWA
eukprot:6059284-Karenia_brevis.AAC.1